jgi:hypothetical protein
MFPEIKNSILALANEVSSLNLESGNQKNCLNSIQFINKTNEKSISF